MYGGDTISKRDGVSSIIHYNKEMIMHQNNPNNDAYQDDLDNHADQLNPNNEEYNGDEKEDKQVILVVFYIPSNLNNRQKEIILLTLYCMVKLFRSKEGRVR